MVPHSPSGSAVLLLFSQIPGPHSTFRMRTNCMELLDSCLNNEVLQNRPAHLTENGIHIFVPEQ